MNDADRRALLALDIDLEPCGPTDRHCDETKRCPHHGGSWDSESWNDADEEAFQEWRRRTS